MAVRDPYTMDDWRTAMTAILEAPVQRSHVAMLVDRRNARPLTTETVVEMTRFLAEYQAELAGGRAAILVPTRPATGWGE
jgi:hypothetical protein